MEHRMPEVSSNEIATMHAANMSRATQQDERMLRIEQTQDKQSETLSAMREVLGRIDERTKRFDDQDSTIEALSEKVDDHDRDINKAKGMSIAGNVLIGLAELAHMVFGGKH